MGGDQGRKVLAAMRPTKSDCLKNTEAHTKIPETAYGAPDLNTATFVQSN